MSETYAEMKARHQRERQDFKRQYQDDHPTEREAAKTKVEKVKEKVKGKS